MPICLKLDIETYGEVGENSGAVIGTDGRLYIEDFTSYYTMAYSDGPPNEDGSYTMMSQDGRTKSTLCPIKE